MKAYYLQLDGQRQGPFTFDDLSNKKITAQTPAWKEDDRLSFKLILIKT